MEIVILAVGPTNISFVKSGLNEYLGRLNHYARIKMIEIPDTRRGRSMPKQQQKAREGESIIQSLTPADYVVLLDERGRQRSSEDFASWLEKRLASGARRLVMVIGGPYGFSQQVYDRANEMVSLSAMTFNHEMVRMFLAEQLYRAFTILRNEPYHHA